MSYYGFVVTDSGRELIAKLVAGQQLPISKIMVGSGTVPDDVKPATMTALVEPVAAGTSTAPVYDGASVRMIVEYRSDLNGGLDHGFGSGSSACSPLTRTRVKSSSTMHAG